MPDHDETHGELRKEADFREALSGRTEDEFRRELGVPDVDEILKELQRTHGIRISLSRNLIDRLETIKVNSADGLGATLISGCISTDVCILCDHGDICSTCDTMDWCVVNDTHFTLPE